MPVHIFRTITIQGEYTVICNCSLCAWPHKPSRPRRPANCLFPLPICCSLRLSYPFGIISWTSSLFNPWDSIQNRPLSVIATLCSITFPKYLDRRLDPARKCLYICVPVPGRKDDRKQQSHTIAMRTHQTDLVIPEFLPKGDQEITS